MVISSCSLPTTEEAGIRYPTKPAFEVPPNIQWNTVGLAKELINIKDKVVILSGGSNPISVTDWDQFKPRWPWQKNIDRFILIDSTTLIRSPGSNFNCKGADCLSERTYKGYTWIDLAEPLAVDFIPSKTDILKPEKGFLVVKTIKKCQIILFKDEIFQLSDQRGNYYVMHATEAGEPDLNVELPEGWVLKRVKIDEPLIVTPFGDKDDCYFNIVGDHLGQGYHQYKYSDSYYPDR